MQDPPVLQDMLNLRIFNMLNLFYLLLFSTEILNNFPVLSLTLTDQLLCETNPEPHWFHKLFQDSPASAEERMPLTTSVNAMLIREKTGHLAIYSFKNGFFNDPKQPVDNILHFSEALTADWNQDGNLDLMVKTPTGQLTLLIFQEQDFEELYSFPNQYIQHKIGDWNGDGQPDVLAQTAQGELLLFLFQANSANFSSPKLLSRQWTSQQFLTGDWDGNGFTDLLTYDETGYFYLHLFKNGNLDDRKKIPYTHELTHYFSQDWTGNQRSDLLVRTTEGQLLLLQTQPSGDFLPAQKVAENWHFTHYFPGDWDQDGIADLIVRTSKGDIILYLFRELTFQKPRIVAKNWHFTYYYPFKNR